MGSSTAPIGREAARNSRTVPGPEVATGNTGTAQQQTGNGQKLKRCTSDILRGTWFKPKNGRHLLKATMYFVRWNDDHDLSGDSVLFTKTVSPNVCVFRHVSSETSRTTEWFAKANDEETYCLNLVCADEQHNGSVMFAQIAACKQINPEEAWKIIERWHYKKMNETSSYHRYQFGNRFFITAALLKELKLSPLICNVVFAEDGKGWLHALRRPILRDFTRIHCGWFSLKEEQNQIPRCRYEWIMEALTELHRWLPLDRVKEKNPPRIARQTVYGRSHFAELYTKKLHELVPEFVRVENYTPTEMEIWATLFTLRDWWSDKVQQDLQGWTGFYMTQREIDAMTLQVMFALQRRFSILPLLVDFQRTVNESNFPQMKET